MVKWESFTIIWFSHLGVCISARLTEQIKLEDQFVEDNDHANKPDNSAIT